MDPSVTDDELLSRAPDDRADAAAQLRHGVTLQALGYLERSLPPLRRATLLAPTDPNPWFQIAIAFSGTGRTEHVEAVGAVLRELKPSRSDMWFEDERDEAMRPLARFTRAAFLAFTLDNEAFEAALRSLIDDYRDSSLARVQATVGLAEIGLAHLLTARGERDRARSVLDGIITRLGPNGDARARLIVAHALVWRGGLHQQEGDAEGAVANWTQVRDTYSQDEAAAIVVARALSAIGSVSTGRARDEALAEIASRWGSSAQPELRRLAVNALLARDPTKDGGSASIDTVADVYRDDPDVEIARASARARVDRWLSRRPRIAAGFPGRALRALMFAFIALRHRRSSGVEYPEPSPSSRHRMIGTVLLAGGRFVLVVAVVAGIIMSTRSAAEGDAVDPRLLGYALLVIVGHFAAVVGTRMRGRFTVHALALTRARLPRTILSIALALAIAPVLPVLERVGAAFVFGPVTATYGWLGDLGLPTWAVIIAMVPLAPIEVFVMLLVSTMLIVIPARAIFGAESAVAEALADSFGSIEVDRGPHYA